MAVKTSHVTNNDIFLMMNKVSVYFLTVKMRAWYEIRIQRWEGE